VFIAQIIIGEALVQTNEQKGKMTTQNMCPMIPGSSPERRYDSIYGNQKMYVVYSNL
jgi:hypothetical protein